MAASAYPTLGFDPCPGDPAGVTALVGKWRDAAFLLTETAVRLDGTDAVQARWRGRAADAFRSRLDENRVMIGRLRASCEHNADLLSEWTGQLKGFQAEAAALETRAAGLDEQRQLRTQLSAIHTQAGQLRERYLDAARLLARQVEALPQLSARSTGWYGESVDAAREATLLKQEAGREGGPVPVDPALRAAWWYGLTPDEQAAVARDHFTDIGSTIGLPADVADELNRLRLRAEVAKPDCPQRLKDLWHHLSDPSDRAYRSDMYLLGYDDIGNGHVAVSYGNPDTAPNTAVYVPGTGASLDGSSGDLNRALTLYTSANTRRPDSTASIYWLGYDAPDWSLPGPASQRFADAGAPKLAAFVNSLAAHHRGAGHVTVIGHSYGSTLVGDAFAHAGMKADDVVFVGSPGVTVDKASQLGLDPSHVWASKAKFDPVPGLSVSLNPLNWTDDHSVRFGNDPTSSAFGGRTFDAGDGSGVGHAHSEYWDAGPSLDNMTDIVTGRPGEVTTMPTEDKIGVVPNLADLPIPAIAVPDIGGAVLQNLGHHVGGYWGKPMEDAGDSLHDFAQAENNALNAGGDLLTGDFDGALTDAKDTGSAVADSGRNAVKTVTDLFR